MELQWPLMIFTLFICLSAGIFGIAGVLCFMGKGEKIQFPAVGVSLVALAIGGLGSFMHLEHWERIFNGFGHITSGITQEMIAIVLHGAVLTVYFFMLRRSEDNRLPKWCGVSAVAVSLLLVIIMSHSYNMAARPAWDTSLLWLYYLANAMLFGGLTTMVVAGVRGAKDIIIDRIALIGGGVQVVATAAYAVYFTWAGSAFTDVGYYFDPTMPTKEAHDPTALFSLFAGDAALLFWIGVVAVGLLVPIVLAFIGTRKGIKMTSGFAGIGLISALIGGMCFRVILYVLGLSVFTFY